MLLKEHFIFVFSWIHIITGLQCPSCLHLTTDDVIPNEARVSVNKLLRAHNIPECAQTLQGTIPEIKEESCDGKSATGCVFYKGTLELKLLPDINIPVQMYLRGCYNSSVYAHIPSADTCNRGNNTLKLHAILPLDVNYTLAETSGVTCLCSKSYCPADLKLVTMVTSTTVKTSSSSSSSVSMATPRQTVATSTRESASQSLHGNIQSIILFLILGFTLLT